MDDLGAGGEAAPSSRPPEAVEPVGLLAEHEERLVEEADLVGRLAAHEQRRPVERLDLAVALVAEPGAVEGVEQPASAAPSLRRKRYSVASRQSVGSPRTERCSVPSGLRSRGPTTAARGCASANATSAARPALATQASELSRRQ